MTCKEFIDFLVDYFDDALPEGQSEAFEQHLHRCRDCKAYLDSYGQSIELLKSVGDENAEIGSEVPEELVKAILAARPN